jgi:putative endonuclease
MNYVYIIWSDKLDRYYIGSTVNVVNRLQKHNSGKSTYTRKGIPWKLVKTEEYNSRQKAYKREFEIKSFKGGIKFKRLIGEVA